MATPVDGLDHLDRDELVETPVAICPRREVPPVGSEHAHPVRQAGLRHPFSDICPLRFGNSGRGDTAPVLAGGMDSETAPAAMS